jgi:hypothetical protein
VLAEILQQINKEKVWKGVCYFLVILGTLMIQNLLMPHLTILKVRPLIIPAAAVAVGMFEGGTYGAIFGLFLGFFADMSFAENTVLFLVIMGVLGFAAGFAADFYLNRTFIPFMAAAFAGLLFTAVIQMIRPFIMGSGAGRVILTGLLQTVWALPFAALYYPVIRAISRHFDGPSERKDRDHI